MVHRFYGSQCLKKTTPSVQPHLCTPPSLRRARHNNQLVVHQSVFKLAPDPPDRQGLPLLQQFVVPRGEGQSIKLVQLQIISKAKRILRGTFLTFKVCVRLGGWVISLRHDTFVKSGQERTKVFFSFLLFLPLQLRLHCNSSKKKKKEKRGSFRSV